MSKYYSFDSLFSQYGFRFCTAICLESATWTPGYIEGLKPLWAKGHEFLDHAPNHSTCLILLTNTGDTIIYYGNPLVDHINDNRVCFKWESVDTTHTQGEGLINIYDNLVISNVPGEFDDFYSPEYIPMLFIPLTNQIFTWINLKNENPLDPDSLTLRSLWGESVNLGTHFNIPFHKLGSFDVIMPQEALVLLSERILTLCTAYNIERPWTWIQPFGNFPLLTKQQVAQSMGAQLGYTGGATYRNEAYKTYNEYNPLNNKQFGMMFWDFSTTHLTAKENKKWIADGIAKHMLLISQNHFMPNTPTWQAYLQRTDSLLSWIDSHDIPVLTQREWTGMLYDSATNPSINIFPLLQTDLNEDQIPDGYELSDGTMIYDDGVPQSDNRSIQLTEQGTFLKIRELGGLSKSKNTFSFYAKGVPGTVLWLRTYYPETGISDIIPLSIDSPGWIAKTTNIIIPENVSVITIDLECKTYVSGEVRISGMELRGIARPIVMHESVSMMTNQQFPLINLDTLIFDPLYPLQALTITITNPGVLQSELNTQAETLVVNKPSSFWIGRDSLLLKAVNPDGGADSSWLTFSSTQADICKGQSITLNLLNPPAGSSFLWTANPPDPSLVYPTNQNPLVSPHQTTFYNVVVTAPGETYSENLTVSVYLIENVTLTGPLSAYCANASAVQLVGEPPGGIFTGPGVIGDLFYPNIASSGQNKLYYTIIDPSGCVGSDSLSISIQPIPQVALPQDTVVCHWQTVILSAGIGYDSYLWSTGETTSFVTINSSGMSIDSTKQITLIVTKNGCPGFDTTFFSFKACTGIDDFTSSKLRVYPNPITSWLVIENLNSYKDIAGAIVDILGETKMTVKINQGKNRFDVRDLASGLYLLYIQSPGGTSVLRFIKLPE